MDPPCRLAGKRQQFVFLATVILRFNTVPSSSLSQHAEVVRRMHGIVAFYGQARLSLSGMSQQLFWQRRVPSMAFSCLII